MRLTAGRSPDMLARHRTGFLGIPRGRPAHLPHGARALNAADQAIGRALDRQDADRVLLMLRVRMAIAALQAPRSGPLH